MSLDIKNEPDAHCSLFRQFTWELTWRPEQPIYPGMQMEIRCHKRRAFAHWTFVRSHVEGGEVNFRAKIDPTVSQRRQNWECVIVKARFQYGINPGEPVNIELTAVPGIWLGVEPILSVWMTDIPNNFNPDAEIAPPEKEEESECRLTAGPGIVERLSVYSRPAPEPDGKVRTLLVPEDRFGNPSAFANPVTMSVDWNNEQQNVDVHKTTELFLDSPVSDISRAEVRLPLSALGREETINNGRREDNSFVVEGNPIWKEPVGGRIPVFGEFHWHTDISGDAQRPFSEAVRCARDELNMDYVAPGDHNPQGEDWNKTVEALDEANEPGRFATFYGWENGSDRGHENYYFTDPDHPLVCGGEAGITGGRPADVVDNVRNVWEERRDFVSIPHHTNAVAETRKMEDDSPFWHPYPWTEPEPFIRNVEIMQTRGNQERNDYTDAWRGWHQNNKSSAQDALCRGHRLGFTGGTDNHCGWPGRAFAECEGSNAHPPKSVILTGLWAQEKTRAGVFNALCNRRSWAVWDTRALVDFRVEETPAGQVMMAERGAELRAQLRLSAEDALRVLEIVSDGNVVWSTTAEEKDVEMEIPLGVVEESTYFYMRALEHKGGIIYASPVYVEIKSE